MCTARVRYLPYPYESSYAFTRILGVLVHLDQTEVRVICQSSRSHDEKIFLIFGYGCTLRGDAYKRSTVTVRQHREARTRLADCSICTTKVNKGLID